MQQALPILPVRVKCRNSDRFIETYAFLDCGSTTTFCSNAIMRDLNIEGRKTKLDVLTLNQRDVKDCYAITGLEISDLNGNNLLPLPTVYSQEELPASDKDIVSASDIQKWSYLRNIPLQRIDSNHIGLLIGVNVPKAMEPWKVVPSEGNGPFAVETLLVRVINGPLDIPMEETIGHACNRIDAVVSLEDQLRNQFNFDFNERTIDDVECPSKEDRQFIDSVSRSITHTDGHYYVNLPFKEKDNKMPNNRTQASQRLTALSRRFEKDEMFKQEYTAFMEKVLNEGHASEVSQSDLAKDNGKVWYLPHHGVYHPRKKKLRVVFDCAARFRGTSLNDRLLQGPNLTNTLIGTLIRFRENDIAIMGDIDSMFHQVRVPKEDASFLRFLWWKDGNVQNEPTEYQMNVHLFGATSSPSCVNYALRQTANNGRGKFNDNVIETVLRNFYVDDCLTSVNSVEDGIQLVENLRKLLHTGGFNISKWISSNREVMRQIPHDERAKEVHDLDLDQDSLPIDRALGIQWCVDSDAFCFKIVVNEQPNTRRGILSRISSVYDPLGFLAPFTVSGKMILQELCRLHIGWDDTIPKVLSDKWISWLNDLQILSELKVIRCFKPPQFGEVTSAQLHTFSDASESGYGTVTYLRIENEKGDVHCSFVMGKARVAPLKQVTIPRLELTAATVAVKTNKMLISELDIPVQQSVFWTDSMSVLRYIQNSTSRFHTFVANRLSVIHEGSNSSDWKYVPTKENPADLASRGTSATKLLEGNQWMNAPTFLWKDESYWPKLQVANLDESLENDPEVKRVKVNASLCSKVESVDTFDSINTLINRHSSWYLLKRNIAWILKIRRKLLQRVNGRKEVEIKDPNKKVEFEVPHLTVSDLTDAERAILKFVQREAFPTEFDSLKESKDSVKRTSHIRNLDPIYDDGLLRVGGRLHKADLPMESKHPIILPKNHHVSELILRHIHEHLKHSGRNHMLSYLRQRFWIVNAASAIRKIISKCVICRRFKSPVGEQKMANLPEDRLVPDEPPFTRVGVDYFGPFEVKVKRSRVKRYGVIFTCLASRAVHLEVASSLDTDSYIHALRRFIARRGQVQKMRSDNGTNFVGAERELKACINEWNLNQIHESMLQRNIDWAFNPPSGSHHGGVWERLIRSIRKAMNSTLKEQILDDEGLHTLMCEVESILNNRPITRNTDSHRDLEPLTPNHILTLKQKPHLPPGLFFDSDIYLRRRWRQVQYMSNLFWHRWVREYLPLLQERQKWNDIRRNLKEGDIVLVVDTNSPRNSWPMGVVLQTFPDRKGLVRQVIIKTATNTLKRPIDKLILILECEN